MHVGPISTTADQLISDKSYDRLIARQEQFILPNISTQKQQLPTAYLPER